MASRPLISLTHAPRDLAVADHLAADLARQGVPVSRDVGTTGAVLLVLGPMSAADCALQATANYAAETGRPLHVVRLGEARYDWPALQGAASWTDAFGADAEANVAALAARLRALSQAAPAGSPWAPPPSASPFGIPSSAASAAPPPWGIQPAGVPTQPFAPPAPPPSAAGREPSDRGSLIALFVVGGLGLVLLVLYLTGMLNFASSTRGAGTTTSRGAAASGSTGAVTDQWLTGTWKETCGASEFVRFDLAQGTATFRDGTGRITRSGETLTISGGGGSIIMTVAYVDQDRMRATAQGDTQQLVRCG